MIQAVHHLLDDARLYFIIESLKREVSGRSQDMEGSIEIVTPM